MARKRKSTPTEQAYSKQLRRIRQFIRRAEKRGYQFSENVIPQKPKRITKASVRRLARLTPEKLYKKAVYGGEATAGEIVKGTEGRKAERSESARKAAEARKQRKTGRLVTQEPTNTPGFVPPENISTDTSFFDKVVISGFREHVSQFNDRASSLLLSWLNRILQTNDEHDVAVMLNDGVEAGNIVTYQIVYSSDKLYEYMSNMLDYLPDQGELFKEEIMDAMEMEEDYNPIL